MTTLWLFDLDGTLVNINPLHLQAHQAAYKEIFGVIVPTKVIIQTFGMTGLEGPQLVLRKMRIHSNEKIGLFIKKFYFHLDRKIASMSFKPLPGVTSFLNHLKRDKENILEIVTGNREKTGKQILKKSGLFHYFTIFSYGEGRGREEIVKNAIEKAENLGPVENKIVLGDTITDIRAGKSNLCFTVGVATGSTPLKDLKKEKPTLTVKSLQEYMDILQKIQDIKWR